MVIFHSKMLVHQRVFPVISGCRSCLESKNESSRSPHRSVVLAKQQEIHHSPLSRWPRGEAVVNFSLQFSVGKAWTIICLYIPSGNSSPWYRWPIEIDGLLFLIAWVDLSMAMLVITRWYIYVYIYIIISFQSIKRPFFCYKYTYIYKYK